MRKKVIIMGAAGRDFHNFNICFRNNPQIRVVAFTAAQIPFIERRVYPPILSGPLYPRGIPIHPEEDLAGLIKAEKIDSVVFSYSDVSYDYVMHRASLCVALGADFVLLGSGRTMLKTRRPVISVCAVRTGCGKSGVTRFIAKAASGAGFNPVVIRHPMPYGDLAKQKAQRFKTRDDLRASGCTIEEMEEYEPLISEGFTVFAGVDYREILKKAEKEADLIIWDGGNNDLPFIKPDLEIVVADPLRPGHEVLYYPGEANLRRAGVVIINKSNSAPPQSIETVMNNIKMINPKAVVIKTASVITVDKPMAGKRVLVVEDGPTLTHGGMGYGAGTIAAKMFRARPVDVRPYAVGTIKKTLIRYPHIKNLLPAMGYSRKQVSDLEETIERTPADAVVIATPVNLAEIIDIRKPTVRVSYTVRDIESPGLKGVVKRFLKRLKSGKPL